MTGDSAPLHYLATPYSRYPHGLHAAFREAARLAGELVRRGHLVYSPIAHTHPLAVEAGLDPLDCAMWLDFDAAMMARSDVLLVAMMAGWSSSVGVAHEIAAFRAAGKPIRYLDPLTLAIRETLECVA